MSWVGDSIPVLASREDGTRAAAAESLRGAGLTQTSPGAWSDSTTTVSYEPVASTPPVLPFNEEKPSPEELAGWFLVRRPRNDAPAAHRAASELAECLSTLAETFIARADGLAFALHDGREADDFEQAWALLGEGADEENDETPIKIDWSALPRRLFFPQALSKTPEQAPARLLQIEQEERSGARSTSWPVCEPSRTTAFERWKICPSSPPGDVLARIRQALDDSN